MLKSNEKSFAIIVAVVVCLAVMGVARADWVEQDKLLASDGAAEDTFGVSVSISGDYCIVGARFDDDKGTNSGSAYIFKRSNVPSDPNWYQQAKLTASDGAAGDQFGNCSISISGDYAIVPAWVDDDKGSESGSAYIFRRDPNTESWGEQAKLTASDGAYRDRFGVGVSISGDYAIVGAYWDDDNGTDSGSAYIFKRDGESWGEQAKLTASEGAAGDWFGRRVSISGTYAIVGALYDDDKGIDSGSAYIFQRSGSSWSQVAKLTASDGAAGDHFGRPVSISGAYAIVGAYDDDDNGTDSGSAYVFYFDGISWTEQAKLTASDGATENRFGYSVSLSGDYAIVGALYDDDKGIDSGSAYIFQRSGSSWSQVSKLTASDSAAGDHFGIRVSISGDYVIVGSFGDDDNGTDSGSAYIFVLAPMLVEIDIKPGSYPNAINLGSHGLIPVAILSTADFDATTVDADTVELAGADVAVRGKSNKFMAHAEDVDEDGLIDLVIQVATVNLDPSSFQDGWAVLTGETYDGQNIEGWDEITIVPDK